MALGFLKKSKKKEEENEDFLGGLEDIKKEVLEPELPKELPKIPELKEESAQLQQLQPLPLPTMQQPQKVESKIEEKKPLEPSETPEIYVKLENYKKVLDLLEKLKVKLKEIESLVNELKSVKDSEISKLEEIKERLEKSKEDMGEVLESLK